MMQQNTDCAKKNLDKYCSNSISKSTILHNYRWIRGFFPKKKRNWTLHIVRVAWLRKIKIFDPSIESSTARNIQ